MMAVARLTAGDSTGGASGAVPVAEVESGDRGALDVPPAPAVSCECGDSDPGDCCDGRCA